MSFNIASQYGCGFGCAGATALLCKVWDPPCGSAFVTSLLKGFLCCSRPLSVALPVGFVRPIWMLLAARPWVGDMSMPGTWWCCCCLCARGLCCMSQPQFDVADNQRHWQVTHDCGTSALVLAAALYCRMPDSSYWLGWASSCCLGWVSWPIPTKWIGCGS